MIPGPPPIRIGVIADTHRLVRPEALAVLAGSELIVHAGDVGGPEVLDALRRGLLATADQLKRAQLGRAPTAVSVAAKAYQDASAALGEESLAHVTGAGHATTAAARNRLTGTLMAAATDPALRELLREGRLSREQTVAGFDVFGDAPPALRLVERSATSRADRLQAFTPPPPEDQLPGPPGRRAGSGPATHSTAA